MKNVRLQTQSKLSDREDAPTESVTIPTASGLQAERQRQSEARVAGDLAVVEKKNSLTKLLTKKQARLEAERAALEAANRKLANADRVEIREQARAAIETAANNVRTLEDEIETLKRTLS